MAKLEFDQCYASANLFVGGSYTSGSDLWCSAIFNGYVDEESGKLCLSINVASVDSQMDTNKEILEADAIVEGVDELETLHAYIGLLISQHRSL